MMHKHAASWNLAATIAFSAIVASPTIARAEGGQLTAAAELEFLYSDVDSENKNTGEKVQTDFSYFKHRYDVRVDKDLYPYLGFRAGGLFEFIDTKTDSSDGFDSGNKQESIWLFSELNLTNPLYTGGLAYRRREFKFDPDDLAATKISREEYSGLFRWRPVGLPRLDLDIDRAHVWDDDDTRDLLVDRLVLKNRYDYRDFNYDYTYTRIDSDRRIEDAGNLSQIHNGVASYSTSFLGDSLQLTTSARLNYQTIEPRGGEVIEWRTTPFGSPFYLLDDMDPGTLTEVDGAHPLTDVNLGETLNSVGIGLDFGFQTVVDTIHVVPQVTGQVTPNKIDNEADSFAWTAFSSDDQVDWTELSVFSAEYDAFENRFEISFASVDTPYIKVVATPTAVVPIDIVILDIQAFTSIETSPGMVIEDFDQIYNLGVQWQVTDDTITTYNVYFRHRDTQPLDLRRTTLSNSVSVQHSFRPWLYGTARVLRTDVTETDRDDAVRHTYSASLMADYLATLSQTLIYSGEHDAERGSTATSNSIFLRTDADLYEGWSANLDLGYSWKSPLEDADISSTSLRIATRLDPNPKLNFNFDYLVSWNTESGEPSRIDQYARFQGFWVPLRTLSFFASVSLRDKRSEGESLKISQDYSANWAPFPDGLLNFSIAYNQSVDTRDNESRVLSPQVDWQVTPTTLLTLRFNIGTLESDNEKRDVKNIRATFRTHY